MNQHHHHQISHTHPRPESPQDHGMHHIHSQDPLYSVHGSQSALYNNNQPFHQEYAQDFDPQKSHLQQQQSQQQQAPKTNGFPSANYRASFSSFPNTTRSRHNTSQSVLNPPSFRDPQQQNSFYPASADVFQPQMTSPIQPHLQPYDSRASYDFGPPQQQQQQAPPNKHYLVDNYGPGAMPHPGKATVLQQQQQQQGQQFSGLNGPTGYTNGIHLTSQTPYGPHIPMNGPQSSGNSTVGVSAPPGAPPGLAPSTSMSSVAGGTGATQEEISTIFVVGFPEDMQEREFQNMFTFSPGFEAATLKIPNKEYTAYGGIVPSSSSARGGGFQPYNAGSNDPYNLVTVNQGGVVVDGGRDGTVASWPAVDDGSAGGPFMGGGVNMPPRKQIIGFAKFRSREEALGARDILQGRRVDIEKGAVLKAEMAKKNLHTKRGVGPVPVGSAGGQQQQQQSAGGLMGGVGINSSAVNDPYGIGDGMMTAREREIGALGAMGLGLGGGRLNQWRDQMQQQQENAMQQHQAPTSGLNGHMNGLISEDRRERDQPGLLNSLGLAGSGRGPRERAEEEERERRRKERLRASNSTAFDAFHSVPINATAQGPAASGMPRQMSAANGNGTSLTENGSSPHLAYLSQTMLQHQQQALQLSQQEEIVGPWDRVNKPTGPPSTGRPRSSSQSSNSAPNPLGEVRSFSPSIENQFHEQAEHLQRQHAQSESSASSIAGGSQSVAGVGGASDGDGTDGEIARAVDQLALNINNGNTSPQLPSPASGASSGSARTGVDQNPPINTLYVGNLPTSPPPIGFPQDYLEESLRELFATRPGFRRLCFRHKSNGPMCFVEFEDVQFATRALNDLYGHTLKGLIKGGGIRLSYSKNPLGVRTPTSAGSTSGSSLQQQQIQSIGNAQPVSTSFFTSDGYQSRMSEDQQQQQPTSLFRREAHNGMVSPPIPGSNTYNNFLTSPPPPRFFAASAGSGGTFGPSSSSTPLTSTSTAFVPRGNGGSIQYSYSLGGGSNVAHNSAASFSPFGIPSSPQHTSIPEQSSSSEESTSHQSHFIHRALSPPSNNIEATRAG